MEEKLCNKCQKMLPIDMFSKDSRKCDGLSCSCKACEKERRKEYYQKNKERIKAKSNQYFKEHHEEKLAYQAQRRKDNPEYMKEYRVKNSEQIKSTRREYYANNREHVLKVHNEWYARTIEERRNHQRERYANDKTYCAQTAIWRHEKDARNNNLPMDFTTDDWFEALEYFDGKCAYCQQKKTLEIDHVIPLSKNGSFTRNNIIPVCKSCNSRKYTSDMETWYRKQDYFSEAQLSKIKSWIDCTD